MSAVCMHFVDLVRIFSKNTLFILLFCFQSVPLNGSDMLAHFELQLVAVVVAYSTLYMHRIAQAY
jgi:hypothetical protein